MISTPHILDYFRSFRGVSLSIKRLYNVRVPRLRILSDS